MGSPKPMLGGRHAQRRRFHIWRLPFMAAEIVTTTVRTCGSIKPVAAAGSSVAGDRNYDQLLAHFIEVSW
jgi:hypothetical protein